ncbi:MAG: MFS transporter [Planctomycetota bacterium]
MTETLQPQEVHGEIRRAHGRFAAMVVTYGLGVFNDSFYRTAAVLLANAVVWQGQAGGLSALPGWLQAMPLWVQKGLPGAIMAMFTLPYLLFASPAGWLADRFAKRRVVIGAKLLELAAMLCGAYGLLAWDWNFILAMVFLMGLQSCIFSPALNGSIPELYPASYVQRANGVLKVAITAMILAGVSASGPALDVAGTGWLGIPAGRWTVAIGAVSVSLLGVLVSLAVPYGPAANPHGRLSRKGPLDTLGQLRAISRDRLLRAIVTTNVYIWFAGSFLATVVLLLGPNQLGLSNSRTSLLVGVEMIGVALGGVASGRVVVGRRWFRALPRAVLALALLLLLSPLLPLIGSNAWQFAAALVLLGLVGISGGLALVPCEAFIQIRPPAERKGAVIASANFAVFAGILVSSPIANGLVLLMPPATVMAVFGGASLLVAAGLERKLSREGLV